MTNIRLALCLVALAFVAVVASGPVPPSVPPSAPSSSPVAFDLEDYAGVG